MMSKYHNRKVEIDGIVFDSVKEANRYQELKLLEAAGGVADIETHPRFEIAVNDQHICYYEADFCYLVRDRMVVEDVKGFKTPVYRLKKKLMQACWGIEITEV